MSMLLPPPADMISNAVAKLAPLGFSEMQIRDVIGEIYQAFGVTGWRFIEEDDYKMVVNMLEYKRMREKKQLEDDNNINYNQEVSPAIATPDDTYLEDYFDPEMPTSPKLTWCFGWGSDDEQET